MKRRKARATFAAYITIKGLGGFQEKFISELITNDIQIYEICQDKDGFTAVIKPYSYLKTARTQETVAFLFSGFRGKMQKKADLIWHTLSYGLLFLPDIRFFLPWPAAVFRSYPDGAYHWHAPPDDDTIRHSLYSIPSQADWKKKKSDTSMLLPISL